MTRYLFALLLAAGCSGGVDRPPSGPVALGLEAAAARNGLPADLVKAIAAVEGGLWLPQIRLLRVDDDIAVAGALELRHGRFNSLARGAELSGTDEATLRIDTDRGTEAGCRVLAELAASTGARAADLASYRDALEELSGHSDAITRASYASQIFDVLRAGGTFPARGGEQVFVAAHAEMVAPAIGVARQAANGTPDFPGATWFSTPSANKWTAGRPDGNGSVDIIAIHDTEGGWNASVATLQNDGGKSVHYIVDADGSRVGQFINETDTGWHVGNWTYNMHSIGIEHVGFASNTAGYSDAQYSKSAELVANIRTRWSVPVDRAHIVGHYQIPNGSVIAESSPPCSDTLNNCETGASWGGASNHRDPGYYWQWCQYMERLGGSCDCNDTYPLWNCTTDGTEAVRCSGGHVEIDHCTAGCVGMAIGTNDVCNHKPGPPPPEDGGVTPPPSTGGESADRYGKLFGGGGNSLTPPGTDPPGANVHGCSTVAGARSSPGAVMLLLGLAALATVRRARRARPA